MSVLVIGASRGIGKALVEHLLGLGENVIATLRTESPPDYLKGEKLRVIPNVDVAKGETLKALTDCIDKDSLKAVYCVAGILMGRELTPPFGQAILSDSPFARDMMESVQVNTLGPVSVYCVVQSLLQKKGLYVTISTRVASIADNGSGGIYTYRSSKIALNMMIKNLTLEPAVIERGHILKLVHPGYIITDMTRGKGNNTVEESAVGIVKHANSQDHFFIHAITGEELPW